MTSTQSNGKSTGILTGFGALFGAAAVAVGAFGAHGLKPILSPDQLAVYQTAVHYMMWHAIAIVWFALYCDYKKLKTIWPGWLFVIGIILFSGSLLVLTFTSIPKFGIITPIGGVCFILGWLGVALKAVAKPGR